MTIAPFDIVDRIAPPLLDRPRSADSEQDNSFYDMLRREERADRARTEPRAVDRATDRAADRMPDRAAEAADDPRPRHDAAPPTDRQDAADEAGVETAAPVEVRQAAGQDPDRPEEQSATTPTTDAASNAEAATTAPQPIAAEGQGQAQRAKTPSGAVPGQAATDLQGKADATSPVPTNDNGPGDTRVPSQQTATAAQPPLAPVAEGRSPAQAPAALAGSPAPASPVPVPTVPASSAAVAASTAGDPGGGAVDQPTLADAAGDGADADLPQRQDGRLPSTLEGLMKADAAARAGGAAQTTAPQAQGGTATTSGTNNAPTVAPASSQVDGKIAAPIVTAIHGDAVAADGIPTKQPEMAAPSSTPSSMATVQPAPGLPSAQSLATMAAVHRAALAGPPVHEQVSVRLQKAAGDGIDRFTMQLRPADLGRVDIAMEVGHDGRVQAVVSADRPETLHLLQRDARALEQALQNAGLQTDGGSLSFDLRGGEGQTRDDTEFGAGSADPNNLSPSDIDAMPASALTPSELRVSLGGIDLRV